MPVKSSKVKSRLSGVLSDGERRQFAKLLLQDVLGVLAATGLIGSTYVISPDVESLALAKRLGATGVPEEDDRGVNSAVLRGIEATGSPQTILVIPSDLPLLRGSDVREVLRLRSLGLEAVISPSQGFDGTNALAYSPSSGLALSYDDDSFWNHIAAASRKGLRTAISCRPGLMFDVDSPSDFRALAAARSARHSAEFARRHGH